MQRSLPLAVFHGENPTGWEKQDFNVLELLLPAVLGFGISFSFHKIGLLARGTLLQSKSHSVIGVCTTVVGNDIHSSTNE